MAATDLPEPGAGLAISDGDFARFRDFFYRKTGIHFADNKRYFVDKRILERMQATAHDSFRGWFTFMRFQASGEELQALINLMTVNETYFYREAYQFQAMVDGVLDEIVGHRPPSRPVRIWSVPCSTGEEPYSIALYLLEHWPRIEQVDVEILAADIDSRVLESARRGVYTERSLRLLPSATRAKYFQPVPGGGFRISRDVTEAVDFRRVNLSHAADTRAFRHIDLIFCRNLLIYFDEAARRQAAQVLYDALSPGGFVFLGHSESMSRISSLFRVRRFPQAIAYQKPV